VRGVEGEGEGEVQSDDSEYGSLLFLSGKLLSGIDVIELAGETEGEGGESKGEVGGVGDGTGVTKHLPYISGLKGGVGRGVGGPNLAKSSSSRFLIRLGVTGNTGLPLIGAGGLLVLEFGLIELAESLFLAS